MQTQIPITLLGRKKYEIPQPNPVLVGDMNYKEAFDFIMNSEKFVLDIETSDLDPRTSNIISIQIGNDEIQYIFMMNVFTKQEELAKAISTTKALVIGHNLKFDISFLYEKIGAYPEYIWDTFTYEKIMTTAFKTAGNYSYGLKEGVSLKYLNQRFSSAVRETFIGDDDRKKLTKAQLKYAATDVILTYIIYLAQIYGVEQKVRGTKIPYILGYEDLKTRIPGLQKVISLEMQFVPVLARIELNGFKLDKNVWIEESNKASIQSMKIESKIIKELENEGIITNSKETEDGVLFDSKKGVNYIVLNRKGKLYPTPFKIGSIDHIREVLSKLGFEVKLGGEDAAGEDSKKRYIESSNDEVLKTIDHPIVELIRQWRSYNKISTSYGKNMIEKISEITERIHAEFNPYYSSGRINIRNPNLANIPAPSKEMDLRKAFIAEEDCDIITADMSSAEVRIIAELCEDPSLIKALNDNIDPHKYVASIVNRIDYDKVTHDQRVVAKRVLFGFAYGAGPATIARQADITYQEAIQFIEVFNKDFPKVQEYFGNLHKEIMRTGYVQTIGGRPRFFDIPSKQLFYEWSPLERRDFESSLGSICRQAGNHPVQGTNADATKRAIILIQRKFDADKLNAKIVNIIHDELVIECHKSITKEVVSIVNDIMENSLKTYIKKVPVKINILVGKHWMKD